MEDIKKIANDYFKAFSEKDIDTLRDLFAPNVSLTDWESTVTGRVAVVEAVEKIFSAANTLAVHTQSIHQDGQTILAQIKVVINDELLHVLDVIDFDDHGLIRRIRAYKG